MPVSVRRLLAFAVDWLVIGLWGGVIFGTVMLMTGGHPRRPGGPWSAQAIGFLTMTLPVVLYFAFSEGSARRASLGKRALALVVSRETGGRLSFRSALLRNVLKFVPWEFGHTVAHQAMYAGEGPVPVWLVGPAAISIVGPVWWLVTLFATGRTPYDRWASARVTGEPDRETRR